MNCRIIVSLVDGRVVPYFADDAIPSNYVLVPESLLKKWEDGKYKDGVSLAKECLMANSSVGTEKDKKSIEKVDTESNAEQKGASGRSKSGHEHP